MKVIQVTAKVFSDEEKPVSGKTIGVEVFNLAKNVWQIIAQGRTNASGLLSVKVSFQKAIEEAPNLRLIEVGANTQSILTQTCYLSYDSRTEVLICDFGEVEQLEETSYKLSSTQAVFKNEKSLLSGQAKRPDISTSVLIRNISAISLASRSEIPSAVSLVGAAAPSDTVSTRISEAGIDIAQPLNETVGSRIILDTYNAELIRFQSEKSILQDRINVIDVDLKKKDVELNASRLELNTAREEVAVLKVNLDKAKIAQADLDNSRAEVSALKINLDRIVASEKELKEKNEIFTQEEKRLAPIETIASNIGEQIDSANKKMILETRPYQIQNIALELNGSLSSDGKSIALTRLVDSKDGIKGAQTLKMDLVSTSTVTSAGEATVPDITGLTESLAKRLMKSLGLNIESMNKSVGKSSVHTVGQAISQSPAAGAKLPLNGVVLVVFAAE